MEKMKFNEVLKLAKRVERTVNSQLDWTKNFNDSNRKTKTKNKSNNTRQNDDVSQNNITINHEKLTSKEKTFLTMNIEHRDEMIVNEKLCNK